METKSHGSGTTVEEVVDMLKTIEIKDEKESRDYLLGLLPDNNK